MKRIFNKKGFALAETLISAVTVISIFTLLYRLIYPLVGGYQSSLNYDDLDSKYVAFYIKEMIETEPSSSVLKLNDDLFNGCIIGGIGAQCKVFSNIKNYIEYDEKDEEENKSNISLDEKHYTYQNELCNALSKTSKKNNQFFCNKYIEVANVKTIYLVPYVTTHFKNYVKKNENNEFSRSFQSYVQYMPTHSAAKSDKKNNYLRLIVEIEHDSFHTAGEKYYSYATIEVRKNEKVE